MTKIKNLEDINITIEEIEKCLDEIVYEHIVKMYAMTHENFIKLFEKYPILLKQYPGILEKHEPIENLINEYPGEIFKLAKKIMLSDPITKETYEQIIMQCFKHFKHTLENAQNNSKNNEENIKEVLKEIKTKTAPLMFSAEFSNALSQATSKSKANSVFDNIMRGKNITIDGINIFTPDGINKIGAGAAKIFFYSVTAYTSINQMYTANNLPATNGLNLRIFLSIEEYARANEVNLDVEQEKKEEILKNFRRKLKGYLDTLLKVQVTGTEKVRGKKGSKVSYSGMNYLGAYEIKGDTLMIEFTQRMAEILVQLPLLPIPPALYKIKDRDFNALAIAYALMRHYGQNNNVMKDTENKLSIENLLKCTSYPTYEELQITKSSWEQKIKEPFEQVLDRLMSYGFLKDWGYLHRGGKELTDNEAANITTYGQFLTLILRYELYGYETHNARKIILIKEKQEKIKKINSRRKKH